MIENKRLLGGGIGTIISALGINIENLQAVESIVAIICTSLGAIITIISAIIIPTIRWYKEAKKDGKISADEAIEGAETIKKGLEEVKKDLEDKDKTGE